MNQESADILCDILHDYNRRMQVHEAILMILFVAIISLWASRKRKQ